MTCHDMSRQNKVPLLQPSRNTISTPTHTHDTRHNTQVWCLCSLPALFPVLLFFLLMLLALIPIYSLLQPCNPCSFSLGQFGARLAHIRRRRHAADAVRRAVQLTPPGTPRRRRRRGTAAARRGTAAAAWAWGRWPCSLVFAFVPPPLVRLWLTWLQSLLLTVIAAALRASPMHRRFRRLRRRVQAATVAALAVPEGFEHFD